MKLRAIAFLLVIALTLLLIPAPAAEAVATTPNEIIQQIRTSYKRSLRGSGMSSFHGYCGTLVSWQTYCMGIDKSVYLCDGNEQFDRYSNVHKTTGGYSIKTYPAGKYNLLSAMNAITQNGTQDAYNMVVGFHKTNTAAGQKYGHAVFVHAVIDGIVYFVESYNINVGGKYYPEGEPISCTIEEFCKYYDRWTVFEGIAYFGLKTYADLCTRYTSTMKAMALADGYIYEEPGDPGVHEPEAVAKLHCGQWLTVTSLLKTPNGQYWYEVKIDNRYRYVQAQLLSMGSIDTSGLTVTDLKTPAALHKGYGFNMSGTVASQDGMISKVRVSVSPVDMLSKPIFSAELNVDAKSTSLNKSQLNNALTFRKLPVGEYQLRLSVQLEIHVFDAGEVTIRTEEVCLWNGRFLVKSDWSTYPTVKLDGNGGKTGLDQLVIPKNAALGSLPEAQRSGYAFAGWTLDKAGTQPVTAETVISKNTTLYAQWTPGHSGVGGWQETENGWHYCAGDSPVEGWFEFGDLKFYQFSDGSLAKGWVMIEQKLRYFNDAGALITRLEGPGTGFDAQTDGKGTLGWVSGEASGPVDFGGEGNQNRLEQVEKMPAAGRAMQKLSASIYYLAVKITSGQLPQQLQEVLE